MFEECRLEGNFTLTSGRKSPVFYDFNLLKPREAAEYVERLIDQVPASLWRKTNYIAAPALGGIIPGFLAAFAKDKPLLIVTADGTVLGPEVSTGTYLIVDDVVTSFTTVRRTQKVLEGLQCLGVMSYIFRGTLQDLKDNADIPLFYLARKEEERA